jgi:hypothetical protein
MPFIQFKEDAPVVFINGIPRGVTVLVASDTDRFDIEFSTSGTSITLSEKTPPPPKRKFIDELSPDPFTKVQFTYPLTATSGAANTFATLKVEITSKDGDKSDHTIQVQVSAL